MQEQNHVQGRNATRALLGLRHRMGKSWQHQTVPRDLQRAQPGTRAEKKCKRFLLRETAQYIMKLFESDLNEIWIATSSTNGLDASMAALRVRTPKWIASRCPCKQSIYNKEC